jgi:hypothetical protein
MELLSPTRITSLEGQTIRVIVHKDKRRSEELSLANVYPFETVFNLKQRISLAKSEDKTYLPKYLFVAQDSGGANYQTLEYFWPFGKTLKDPFDAPGIPDPRIYEDGSRKGDVFPNVLSGITVEAATSFTAAGAGAGSRVIHVWTAAAIATAAGITAGTLVADEVFEGFFQLYFPLLKTKEDLLETFKPRDAEDDAALSIAREYRKTVDERLAKVDAGLHSISDAPPMRLRELRNLRYLLPKKEELETSTLELKFYEMNPNPAVPFIRYFAQKDASLPLIKLATGPTGAPLINNPKLLDLLMADNPDTEKSAVILLKSPIDNPQAPLGTTWSMSIFEDGTASLRIGAPRKDAPLTQVAIEAAFAALPAFLENTAWSVSDPRTLVDLTAVYDFKSKLTEKPTRAELRGRLDAFVSFFNEEPLPDKSKATLMLRYRAVNNFDSTNDPLMNHLTNIYLRDTKAAATEIPEEEYVLSLTRYFGLPQADAAKAVEYWINSRLAYILADKETAIQQMNMGTAVGVGTNNFPYYTFYLANVESMKHLQRVLSLLTVFASLPATALKVADAPRATERAVAAVAAAAEATPESSPESAISSESSVGPPIGFQQFDFGDEDDDVDPYAIAPVAAPATAPTTALSADTPPPPAPHLEVKEIELPAALKAGEKIPPVSFLSDLKKADPGLFEIKGATGDIYSKKCQKNAFKQPFVMTPENYLRARTIYKNDVFWVEAPLSTEDLQAVTLANKTPEQRKTFSRKPLNLTIDELKEKERRALEMGFPLKNDESILFDGKVPATAEEKRIIRELIKAQKSKPLWTVLRAGSVMDRPNYFWCGILWCVRDELPIIPDEYTLPTLRNGEEKPYKVGCPFCGGTIIEDTKNPGAGETIFKREPSGKGSAKIAQYIGFPKEIYHPDGYPVPCCFVDPDDLAVPASAKELPPPHPDIPLPDIQRHETPESTSDSEGGDTPPAKKKPEAAAPVLEIDENRERPFAALRLRGGAQNSWYIPAQNVVGRNATEWYSLGRGEVGVPPPSVNKIIGQDPDVFLTANKGALGMSINSYLKSPGSAFVRYSIGNSGILGLICFAEYASAALQYDESTIKINNPEDILTMMFETKEVAMVHAFEQANYGTLVHEFANPTREINDMKFQTWCGTVGIPLRSSLGQRAYAEHLYKAWLTFKDYMEDGKQTKDLRLFEGLFATPRLLTLTGFVIVRIITPKNPSEKATIVCPEFGASLLQQEVRPPLLFVVQDGVTGAYDPLVLYDSSSKDSKRLLGMLQPDTPDFGTLSTPLREALASFIAQYYGPFEGCGRISEPINPWIPELETTLVPRAKAFLSRIDTLGLKLESFLRDRSNRLVGCLVRQKKPAGSPVCFIPLLDDGSIFPWVASLRGEEALPKPPLQALLDMLMGARYPPAPGKLASDVNFPGLLPVSIGQDGTNFISIDLKCGAIIPIEPFSTKSTIAHQRFAQLQSEGKVTKEYREDFPWDTDITLLGPTPKDAPTVETTDEEQLEEAYQHLRISFSHWLHSSAAGVETQRQIELLRRARRRLPLWDLRKRMDVLIGSVLFNSETPWMTTEGNPVKTLLRRDCLQIKKEKICTGGCSWAGETSRCLIHTPATERYVDPSRVLAARLVDELIRTFSAAEEILKQKVPFLRPLASDALVKGTGSLLFAAEGRGSTALYDRLGYSGRKPTAYTKGLTYPEEVDMEVEGVDPFMPPIPEDWASKLRPAIFGADISRDPRARLETVLESISKKSMSALEAELGDVPLDGSPAALEKLAEILDVNILTTAYNPETRRAELDRWYGSGSRSPPEEATYLVLDLLGIPLERTKKPGAFKSAEHRLPKSIRAWLSEHTPE